MMNSEMFNCWTNEIRDYFGVDVSDDTVQLVRNKIEETMLKNLRPKMTWVRNEVSSPLDTVFHCSNCGNEEMYKTPFCPQCGAMEEKENGN